MGQEKTNTISSCCGIIKKAFGRNNFDEVVHKLIYPALLGSMIYDMFKPDFINNWKYKSGIVLFFLLDYYHVFTFLDKKFEQIKKTPICISVDFLVSVFLTLAYHFECPVFLCVIPFLFAIYACKMIKEKLCNEIPIWILHIMFGLITIFIYCCSALNDICLIYIMVFIYFILMLIEIYYSEIQKPSN